MRLARLDLIRFGKFTGSSFDLPGARPDLHLVVGRNEAGKTTAMAAIEDLLFGVPARTPYAFRHHYDELRIGGVLESDGDVLAGRRRKGNRDTLLDEADTPNPEGERTLRQFLGGADREFFLRMFSLSHDRLAQGGREIVAAEGDVGETLFAAGAALRGLRPRRKALDAEATSLWTPRRAKTRRFYQAADRFTEVEKALRQGTKQPAEWKRLAKERDAAQRREGELETAYRTAAVDSRRCSRIRRLLPTVRRLADVESESESLADVVLLPADAAARLAASRQEAAQAVTETKIHQQTLEQKQKDRDAIRLDPAVRERRNLLGQLEAMRVKVEAMRLDLPKRQGERGAALRDFRRAAQDFGWDTGTDDSRIAEMPSDRQFATLSELLQQRGTLLEAERAAATALSEADRRLGDHRARIAPDRRAAEAQRLDAVVRANPSGEDLDARLRDLERHRDECREVVAGLRGALAPLLPDDQATEAALRRLPVPGTEEIARSRDHLRNAEDNREEVARRLAEARRQLRAEQRRRGELQQGASGLTRSSLDRARSDRDAAWGAVKERLLNGAGSENPEVVAGRFEELTREADRVADHRFERAEAAGRLAATEAAVREWESTIEGLVAEESELKEEQQRLRTAWRSLWEGCPFEPLSPERMASWIATLDELANACRALGRSERELEALRAEEREVRDRLTDALLPFGVSADETSTDPLRAVIRRAEGFVQKEREAENREKDARADVAESEHEHRRARARLDQIRKELEEWQSAWSRALEGAGLAPVVPSADKAGLLTEMRVSANKARDIQVNRIATMEREIGRFEELAERLVSELDPELAELPADEAAIRLRDRARDGLERQKECEELDTEIRRLEEAIREARAAKQRSEAGLQPLWEAAGATDSTGLATAIERSDRKRALDGDRARLLERIDRDADGLSLAEVRAECDGAQPDEAKAGEEIARSHLEEIGTARNQLAERLGEIRKELEAFEADDAAARLAADREAALAAVRETAERYARLRAAEVLLRWALERFRREKQGPMLRRAGELFRTLTSGSFASLEVGFDAKDQLRLEAIRSGGEKVLVTGLSSGSEDQLYLALRVAAIEDYVRRAPALPFLADDLFVNFDEDRAAAGFRILGNFARSTQVLFFTHHEHLVAIARDVLGEAVPVIRLEEA